ncbi:MAG: hypothetical protein KY394_05360, partial [Actinobacteria bacterium]|nr:hypothetical protein [Actinomycetota bacterium]
MEARSFADPALFRRSADPLLLRHEARNNLILGVTGTLVTRPEVYPEFHLWLVEECDEPVAAAAMTPPQNLLLADPDTEAALASLAEVIAGSGVDMPGILGNEPWVGRFVEIWAETTGQEAVETVSHGVFAIDEVEDVPVVPGGPRPASSEDLDLLTGWVLAFHEEADPRAPTERIPTTVRSRLPGDGLQAGFWIWELEGVPMSLSGHGGQTPSGIRIGPVYTPEPHRRHGYATALVAAQSRWLLENGHRYC